MATKENSSTVTEGASDQLREIADQLAIFSDVIACSFETVSSGSECRDDRTVAAFALSRIGTELASFSESINSMIREGGAA